MERRILVIIETILRAEEALQGLAELEGVLQAVADILKTAGIEEGAKAIAKGLMKVGEQRRGLKSVLQEMVGIAAIGPQAAAGVRATATATEKTVTTSQKVVGAFRAATGAVSQFFGWLGKINDRLKITDRALGLLRRGLSMIGGFFISVGRSVFNLINPLNWVAYAFNQITRAFRILTALLLFQFFRKMEDVVMGFANAIIGANIQVETFMVRMRTLIGEADRAERYFAIVREASIATGFSLDALAQATFRFASIAGENMQAFQELVARTVQLAFYDPRQGLAGAGMAIMEALTGQFRSLVRRFEIGTLEMARRMREAGFSNIEILRAMMETAGVGADIITDAMDTLAGMVNYLRGSLRELARRLGEPIFDFFKAEMKTVRDWIRENRLELEAWARAIGILFTKAFQDIAELFFDLMDVIRPQDWVEWGLNLMHSFASGLLSGAELVLNVVMTVATLIADFLLALSPPKRGPLAGLFEGGLGLIREWIRGMESADLSAIERIASYAMTALSLLEARGVLTEEGLAQAGQTVYEVLTQAMRQLRELGSLSEDMVGRLQAWFGELFGDIREYLRIYEDILDIQVEIEAREAAVIAAEELIKAQQIIIDQEREIVDQARERVDLAKEALDVFRIRTRGIPRRFTAQRERELEMMVLSAEAEVKAREERLKAAEEELKERRKNLEAAQEVLKQAREQQKIFADQLKALEAQMNMMQRIWAWQERALKQADDLREIGIEAAEDEEERARREEELRKRAAEFYDLMISKLGDLRGRYDALFAVARGFLMYEAPEGTGLLGTIARVEEALGRKLTPAELEAVEKGWLLRDSLGTTRTELDKLLTPVLEFAKGLLGIAEGEQKVADAIFHGAPAFVKFIEGEEDAYSKGEKLRESLITFWKKTLVPLIETLGSFVKGLAGIAMTEDEASPAMYRLGELWAKIGENLGKVLEKLTGVLATPLGLKVASWTITIAILVGWLGKFLGFLSFLKTPLTWLAKTGLPWVATKLGTLGLGGALLALGKVILFILACLGAAGLIAGLITFGIALWRAKGDWTKAVEGWKETWKRMFEIMKEAARKFLAWLGFHSFFTDLLSAFDTGFGRLLTWLGQLMPDFWGIGKNLIRNIISGAESLWGDFEGLVRRIADLWPFSLAKTGPFKVPIRWEYFTEGLSEQLRAAENALTSFARAEIAPVMSEALAPPIRGAARGLVEIHIHNTWDASITAKDREELRRDMKITSYKAFDEVFERVR